MGGESYTRELRVVKQVVLRRTVCVDKGKAKGSEVNVGRPMWNTVADQRHRPSPPDEVERRTYQGGENII